MKRSILTLSFVSLLLSVNAQDPGDRSVTYTIGYYLGYYFGAAWPFLTVALVGYIVYRIAKRKKSAS